MNLKTIYEYVRIRTYIVAIIMLVLLLCYLMYDNVVCRNFVTHTQQARELKRSNEHHDFDDDDDDNDEDDNDDEKYT